MPALKDYAIRTTRLLTRHPSFWEALPSTLRVASRPPPSLIPMDRGWCTTRITAAAGKPARFDMSNVRRLMSNVEWTCQTTK